MGKNLKHLVPKTKTTQLKSLKWTEVAEHKIFLGIALLNLFKTIA